MTKSLMRAASATLAILVLSAATSAAQQAPDNDEKEINSYRLTMASVKKLEAVVDNLAAWVKSSPEAQAHIRLQAQVDSLGNKEELTEAEQEKLDALRQRLEAEQQDSDDDPSDGSIAGMAAELGKFKPLADALRKAGMSPREYVVFSLAMVQASMFAELKKQGLAAQIPKNVNAENIRFAEQHSAEISRVMRRMQDVGKGLEGAMKRGS